MVICVAHRADAGRTMASVMDNPAMQQMVQQLMGDPDTMRSVCEPHCLPS